MKRLRDPLPILLVVQAVLVFARLDFLSPWMDEVWTIETLRHGWAGILDRVARDVHPPLYFLIAKAWQLIPLPGGEAERIRALSGVFALAATILLDRLWLRRLEPGRRWLGLALISTSPAMMLYGRMARSYTMQTAIAVVAIWAAWRMIGSKRWADVAYAGVGAAALLYTHYIPGVAMIVAVAMWTVVRVGVFRAAAFTATVLLLFSPWMPVFLETASRIRPENNFGGRYLATGSLAAEQILRIGYTAISFTIGEAFPAISIAAAAIAGIAAVAQVRQIRWSGVAGLLIAAATIAYGALDRWVSYPFVAARLLWLVPFLVLGAVHLRHRRWFWLLPLAAIAAHVSYFSRAGFLNKGYAVPFDELAALIRSSGDPASSLVLVDGLNADLKAIAYQLGGSWTVAEFRRGIEVPKGKLIWIVRNTHDVSPGAWITEQEKSMCVQDKSFHFVAYPEWQRTALRRLPEYFYSVRRCSEY